MSQIEEQRESSAHLLSMMGITPADNREGFNTSYPWKSKVLGEQVRTLFHYHNLLRIIGGHPFLYGPLSLAAQRQSNLLDVFVTGPIFVVSKQLLGEYLQVVSAFFRGEPA